MNIQGTKIALKRYEESEAHISLLKPCMPYVTVRFEVYRSTKI